MTLGNDFAGTIVAAGKGCEQPFTLGDRVYGVQPVSRDGSHTSHLLVKGAYARKAPPSGNIQNLAVLPYSFVTMWLAAKAAGLTRDNVRGKTVLVHGAAGGLGTLALQTLSAWGAKVTAIAKATDFPACYAAGATEAIDRNQNPFATSRGAFDATLNFATWNDELKLLSCLRQGALGHATTVHPLIQNFDESGLDRRRRPDDEPKKADAGDSPERDAPLRMGLVQAGGGSAFRNGSARRARTALSSDRD